FSDPRILPEGQQRAKALAPTILPKGHSLKYKFPVGVTMEEEGDWDDDRLDVGGAGTMFDDSFFSDQSRGWDARPGVKAEVIAQAGPQTASLTCNMPVSRWQSDGQMAHRK
ncbi:hypothetical protein LTR96_007624, partial [Exophiala xenobiotica]